MAGFGLPAKVTLCQQARCHSVALQNIVKYMSVIIIPVLSISILFRALFYVDSFEKFPGV